MEIGCVRNSEVFKIELFRQRIRRAGNRGEGKPSEKILENLARATGPTNDTAIDKSLVCRDPGDGAGSEN